LLDVGFAAKSHHALDTRAIVPAAIEQYDLAAGRQMRDIPLEVPLSALAFVGGGQCCDAANAWVEPLGDALDHATLPAASRPSNKTTSLRLLWATQSCSFTSSHCSRSSSLK